MERIERDDQQPGGWDSSELKHFEERLLDERKRAIAQIRQFDDDTRSGQDSASDELSLWRFHMADSGTETYEREQSFLLASREGRLLKNIDAALRRLYGTPERYGRCDDCGQRIGYERLDAIPYAPTCLSCKRDWEGGRAD